MNQLSCVTQNSRQHGGPREPWKSGGSRWASPSSTWDHSDLTYLLGCQASLLLIKGLCGYQKSLKAIQLESGIRGPTSSDLTEVLPKEDFCPQLLPTSLTPLPARVPLSLPPSPFLISQAPFFLSIHLTLPEAPQARLWAGEESQVAGSCPHLRPSS